MAEALKPMLIGISATIGLIAPLQAQTAAPTPQQQQAGPPTNSPSDNDVVVNGIRDIGSSELSETKRRLNTSRTGNQERSRENFAISDKFARCSIKAGMSDIELLHLALDSVTNSVRQDHAQRRFVQQNAGCAADSSTAVTVGQTTRSGTSVSNGMIQTGDSDDPQQYYDRGAMFVRAIQTFAPGLRLTKEQMDDPAVQARFVAREQPLARFRAPQDRQYLGVAICVVHYQPALSIMLVTKELSASTGLDIAASIVNRARSCFGNARHVYFDASQFRFYLADALYRWALAVRGADSLIPGWDNVRTEGNAQTPKPTG